MSQKKNYKKPVEGAMGNVNRRGNNRKPQTKRPWKNDFVKDTLKDGSFDSGRNDWRWYATNAQLVKDAASYPFGYPLGSRIQYGPYGTEASKRALPGICTLAFVPTVGYSDNTNSPINIASRAIYTDMRKANAGASNYDPVDMMVYLASMDSAYFLLEHYKRGYGVARSVSPVNRYYPKALVEALGFDYDSLVTNLDDFRAMINTYAQKLKALVIPNGMSYMAKHQWMCSGVYKDRDTDKSQLYAFIPKAYYTFAYDADNAGMLVAHEWSGRKTFAQTKDILDSVINPILANQDFAIMSGDLLKWRGENGVVRPTGITETYEVFATYDDTVLDQIQNATVVGKPRYFTRSTPFDVDTDINTGYLVVHQDANKEYLVSKPFFTHPWSFGTGPNPNPGRNVYMSRRLLNFVHGNVTPEEVMEASRLTNIGAWAGTNSNGYDMFTFKTMGSEVIVDLWFWAFEQDSNGDWDNTWWNIGSISDVFILYVKSAGMDADDLRYDVRELQSFIREINYLSCFNRHPMIALSAGGIDESAVLTAEYGEWLGYVADIDYYTVLDDQDLTQMSEVALLSEFNVRIEG